MSYIMKLIGTLMAVFGVVLGIMILAKPGLLDAFGIRLDTAVLLLVGGVLSLGLGSVIDALMINRARPEVEPQGAADAGDDDNAESEKPYWSRKSGKALSLAAGAATAAAAVVVSKKPDPVAETISALEQAKADMMKSMSGMDALAASPSGLKSASDIPAVGAGEHLAAEPEGAEEDLYVMEEKVIRGRPARVLSDETIEAETDEGWMRFENLEHLNEYLDSVEDIRG